MSVVTKDAAWECSCPSDHRPTITRAWCFDCSEWCYPESLCVRGESAGREAENRRLREALERLVASSAGWWSLLYPNDREPASLYEARDALAVIGGSAS